MDPYRPHRRNSSSDRYFILFSPPPGSASATVSDDSGELHEDDIFSANAGSDPLMRTRSATAPSLRHVALPDSSSSGMLSLLHDTKSKPAASSTNSLLRTASIASATSARKIPAPKPKVKDQENFMQYNSAPMNIPVGPPRKPRGGMLLAGGTEEEEEEYTNGEEKLPPHEIVARKMANTPITASSCLEGAGRTLKGRDLRRVRNAVWRQTGFLD